MLEVRRDIEYALCGSDAVNAAADPGSATAARYMGDMESLITPEVDKAGTAFTEADVLEAHEKCFVLGGDPNQLQVTPQHSISVANFAYNTGRERDVRNEKKLVNTVSIYESPFG
ncbi:unnamed protein product, partial [marine sediment metagenome]